MQKKRKTTNEMSKSAKWIIGIIAGLVVVGMVGLVALAGLFIPVVQSPSPTVGPIVTEEPAESETLADGAWFAFISVDGEYGPTMLTVDVAEMLTGEPAREAAVKAGVIGEDEELPNDFFIANPDSEVVRVKVAEDAVISVLSGESPDTPMIIDGVTLESIYNGSYNGPAVYGIAPDQPFAVNLTIVDGVATAVEAVYLP